MRKPPRADSVRARGRFSSLDGVRPDGAENLSSKIDIHPHDFFRTTAELAQSWVRQKSKKMRRIEAALCGVIAARDLRRRARRVLWICPEPPEE